MPAVPRSHAGNLRAVFAGGKPLFLPRRLDPDLTQLVVARGLVWMPPPPPLPLSCSSPGPPLGPPSFLPAPSPPPPHYHHHLVLLLSSFSSSPLLILLLLLFLLLIFSRLLRPFLLHANCSHYLSLPSLPCSNSSFIYFLRSISDYYLFPIPLLYFSSNYYYPFLTRFIVHMWILIVCCHLSRLNITFGDASLVRKRTRVVSLLRARRLHAPLRPPTRSPRAFLAVSEQVLAIWLVSRERSRGRTLLLLSQGARSRRNLPLINSHNFAYC